MAREMIYKGVRFDCYTDDRPDNGESWGSCWSEICFDCWKKYGHLFGSGRFDDSGSGSASCGVKGCGRTDAYIYVDFKDDEVEFQSV